MGDTFIYNGPTYDSVDLVNVVGSSEGSCVVTKSSAAGQPSYFCTATNVFADGSSISIQGVVTSFSGASAIVGGTGDYEGASGSLVVATVSFDPVIIQTQTFHIMRKNLRNNN